MKKIFSLTFITTGLLCAALLTAFTLRGNVSQGKPAANRQRRADSIPQEKTHQPIDTTAARANDIVKTISDSLAKMNERLPVEKVYLHTDKPYYNIGDTIWFKAYLVDNITHTASKISKLLYVQLQDDSVDVADRISIRIKDGVGWGQMALRKAQYHEGNYTMMAYTTWMENFEFDNMYTQRMYLNTPAEDAWLVKSNTDILRVDNKNQLQVALFLNKLDKQTSPVAFKEVEVKIYDNAHYLFKQDMQTGVDGSLKFSGTLRDNMNGRRIRVELTSLDPDDHLKKVTIPLLINRNQKIDLQFLPEGGKLVSGLKSVVGFKALGEDGRGTSVSGGIFDSRGNRVSNFTSLYKGMGSVEITPKANETYTARIEQPAGVTEEYKLPKAETAGTVIHISNPEKSNTLKVSLAGLNSIAAHAGFYLVGTTRNQMYYGEKIMSGQTEVAIDKNLFPTGITRFTLFNGLKPINERIVYIDHQDNLQINIKPNKQTYGKRDSVNLAIEVKDKDGFPVEGSFSLAVTDNAQVKADSVGDCDITARLLIGAGLRGEFGITSRPEWSHFKGEIESPGYYINRPDKQAWEALDNLMLTQGWTDYKWEKVFNKKIVRFAPQTNFDITGKLLSYVNRTANVPVLVFSQKAGLVRQTTTNKDGIFVFKDLQTDSGTFSFQVLKQSGKMANATEIKIYKFFNPYYYPPSIKYPILPWYVNSDTTDINRAKLRAEQANLKLTGNVLREVKIRDKKIIRGSWNAFGPGNADYIFDENDLRRSGVDNLYDFLTQNIPGIRSDWVHIIDEYRTIAQLTFNHRYVKPNIDGKELEIDSVKYIWDVVEELRKIQLARVRGIELVYSKKFTNVNDAQPRLIITTYQGNGTNIIYRPGTKTYRPMPITPARVFYSPKYGLKTPVETTDYRSTLFWEPNIVTDRNGKARVSFYTSDNASGLTFNMQGASTEGNLGSLFYRMPANLLKPKSLQ